MVLPDPGILSDLPDALNFSMDTEFLTDLADGLKEFEFTKPTLAGLRKSVSK